MVYRVLTIDYRQFFSFLFNNIHKIPVVFVVLYTFDTYNITPMKQLVNDIINK